MSMAFPILLFFLSFAMISLSRKINAKPWRAIFIVAVSMLGFVGLYYSAYTLQRKEVKRTISEKEKFHDIFFQGNVIASYTKNGTTLLCVALDSSNTEYFYQFNRYNALWVQDGMAVFPIGLACKYDSCYLFKAKASYVLVNKNHSGQIEFIRGDDTLFVPLTFWPGKIEEVHLSAFDYLRKASADNGTDI